MTGLQSVAGKRVGGFSLGMGQRLGIAAALLGDPQTLLLDEPVNGLDPEGVLWVRTLMRELAAQGRTIFLSSHLMSEMALTADHILVLGRGRILADAGVADIIARSGGNTVRGPQPPGRPARRAAARPGRHRAPRSNPAPSRSPAPPPQVIGEAAAAAGLVLHELAPRSGHASRTPTCR